MISTLFIFFYDSFLSLINFRFPTLFYNEPLCYYIDLNICFYKFSALAIHFSSLCSHSNNSNIKIYFSTLADLNIYLKPVFLRSFYFKYVKADYFLYRQYYHFLTPKKSENKKLSFYPINA